MKLKLGLKGKRFASLEEIQGEMQEALDIVTKKTTGNVSRDGRSSGMSVSHLKDSTFKGDEKGTTVRFIMTFFF